MRTPRLNRLPEEIRRELKAARLQKGLSQDELGRRIGIPQMHVSGIETGRIVPRFDTLLDYARALDRDVLVVSRPLVPAVTALIRDYRRGHQLEASESLLYAVEDAEIAEGQRPETRESRGKRRGRRHR